MSRTIAPTWRPRPASPLRGLGLTTQKLPERLEVVDEMPRTPSGKIRKTDLRDRLEPAPTTRL